MSDDERREFLEALSGHHPGDYLPDAVGAVSARELLGDAEELSADAVPGMGRLYKIGDHAWVSEGMMDMLLSMGPDEAAALTGKMVAMSDQAYAEFDPDDDESGAQ